MAVRTKRTNTKSKKKKKAQQAQQHRIIVRYLPVWVLAGLVAAIILPNLLAFTFKTGATLVAHIPGAVASAARATGNALEDAARHVGSWFVSDPEGKISPVFTAQVSYWEDDLVNWAETYDLDANLLATVMQIESCGHPDVTSSAGAQGLFQVMPFHFTADEVQTDPETNARRGAQVLKNCLSAAEGDVGLAMACYNGGPSVISRNLLEWPDEAQRYHYWGTGIYADVLSGKASSARLDEWLAAGGRRLCNSAQVVLETR